ncbi:MAG TPA: HAMP domain-containing sensor histidine kinase [Kineosporiaceae bacterium]
MAPRLFLAGLLIVAAGAVTLPVVAVLLAPTIFHEHLRRAHLPRLDSVVRDHVDTAFDQAMLVSLVVAVSAAAVAAAAIGWLVARRLAAPVHQVATAAQRLADGHYDVRMPDPRLGPEFASVADSMTRLAHRLAATEADRRRVIADLAHQLRTPLAAVRATVEALTDGVLAPDAATLAVLSDQTDRLGRLVVDLEKVSRAQERRIVLDPVPQPLGALVERAVAAAAGRYRAKGVELTADVDPAAPPARVDPGRLAEILDNLLDNALRHTRTGGEVTVVLRRRDLSSRPAPEIVVTDTGDGFDPQEAELLFQRFHRGRSARTEKGSGLGLTIARAVAEAHGGTLVAASDGPGRGAMFTLRLPPAA